MTIRPIVLRASSVASSPARVLDLLIGRCRSARLPGAISARWCQGSGVTPINRVRGCEGDRGRGFRARGARVLAIVVRLRRRAGVQGGGAPWSAPGVDHTREGVATPDGLAWIFAALLDAMAIVVGGWGSCGKRRAFSKRLWESPRAISKGRW